MLEFVILLCILASFIVSMKKFRVTTVTSPRFLVCTCHGKKKNAFTIKSLLDNPRRTEISCVSSAQLPFESGIIKV